MKRNMKKVLDIALAACMAVSSLTGCSNSLDKQTAAPAGKESAAEGSTAQSTTTGDPIKASVSNMVTGLMTTSGIHARQAITAAFEEINANDGMLGERPPEVVLVDDAGTPTGAANAVSKTLGEDVSVSIGPHASPVAPATQEFYREADVPFISTATSPKLLEAENPYFFQISVSDGAAGPATVEFAKGKPGTKEIGTLYGTDDYGVAADGATKQYCADNGIGYYSEGFTSGGKDLASQFSKIRGRGPDVVFSFSYDAGTALIVRQLDELDMGDTPHVKPNTLTRPQTYDLCDAKQLEGAYVSTDFYADKFNEAMKKFLDDFHVCWGEDVERHVAMYYMAAYLIADTIDRAGSDKPEGARKTLSETKDFNVVFGKPNYSTQDEMSTSLHILEFDGEKNMSVTQQISLD